MSSIETICDFLGGIPDRFMARLPAFMLEKCQYSYQEYLERLEYYRPLFISRRERFLIIPDRAPHHEVYRSNTWGDGIYEVIKYPSRYSVRNPLVVADFEGNRANLSCYLHLWRHPEPGQRPLVLCAHGFGMGDPKRALRMFRVKKLYELGLDVVLYNLPHHWKRTAEGRSPKDLIASDDLALAVETWAQNIHDLHSATLLLRQIGYRRIGMIGASLGGYTAALYATCQVALDFVFLVVPAVDLSYQLMPRRSQFSFKLDSHLVNTSRELLGLISPLQYRPVVDVATICVVAHSGDRLCPVEYTRKLVRDWTITNYVEVVGGHWAYLDRDRRGRVWYSWLANKGFIDERLKEDLKCP